MYIHRCVLLAELSFGFHRIDFCGYENENFCVKIIVLQLYYKLFIVGRRKRIVYRICKVLNHNGVIALDMNDSKEYVLLGKGVGFGKKAWGERF